MILLEVGNADRALFTRRLHASCFMLHASCFMLHAHTAHPDANVLNRIEQEANAEYCCPVRKRPIPGSRYPPVRIDSKKVAPFLDVNYRDD